MAETTPADKLIAQARKDRENIQTARKAFKASQDALRGLLSTHNLLGNVLTPEQVTEIAEIAPERKTRESK